MKVLVTGGAGYIGSHTVVELVKNNHEVFVIDNLVNSSLKVFTNLKTITNKDICFKKIDLLNYCELLNVFRELKPDIVIHFAGLKSVSESTDKPLLYYEVNVTGSINLLKAMESVNCNKIIFSSSATVYGHPEYFPIDEKHLCNPINAYGRTKHFIENIIEDWCNGNQTNKAVLLRYFNPAGAHPSGNIGENPMGIPNNLFPFITQVLSGKQKSLNVFGDDYNTPDGTGVRDYIHVCDLAYGHSLAIDFLLESRGCEIINLGSGKGFSVLEIVKTFEKFLEKKLNYQIVSRREGDLDQLLANSEKAKRSLGWETKLTLDDMVNHTLNWMNKYPSGY